MAISEKLDILGEIKEAQRVFLDLSKTLPWAEYLQYMVKKSDYDDLFRRYTELLDSDYVISYNLSDVVSSNTNVTVNKNASYTTTLTPEVGFTLGAVTVIMGELDITSTVYSDGVISIPSVTANLFITASATIKTFTISNALTNVTSSGAATSYYGEAYTATLTPSTGYDLPSVISVTMGGSVLPTSAYTYNQSTGLLTIPNVNGDITITATAAKHSYSVTKTITNGSLSGNATVQHGDTFAGTLSPSANYDLPSSITVKMNGATLGNDSYSYNTGTGTISVPDVTGNLEVIASCALKTYTITRTLTHLTASNTTAVATHGSSYSVTLSPEGEYILPPSITVTMGGTTLPSTAYSYNQSNGVVTIDNITGAIVITASGALRSLSITKNGTNVTINGNASVNYGETYTATLTASEGYRLPSTIVVTMGSNVLTEGDYDYGPINGTLSIANVTDNIIITINGESVILSITTSFTNVTSNNAATTANYGTSYTATLSPSNKNFTINSIVVTMGGVDITPTAVSGKVITIPNVTGDITIAATASRVKAIGDVEPANNSVYINDGELTSGTYTMMYEDENGDPLPNEDIITRFTI